MKSVGASIALCAGLLISGVASAEPGDAPSQNVYVGLTGATEKFENASSLQTPVLSTAVANNRGIATAATNVNEATIKLFASAGVGAEASASGVIRDTLRFTADLTKPHAGMWIDFTFRFHETSTAVQEFDEEGNFVSTSQFRVESAFSYWLPGESYSRFVDFNHSLLYDWESGSFPEVGGYGFSSRVDAPHIGFVSMESLGDSLYKARLVFDQSYLVLPFEYSAYAMAYGGSTVDFTHTAGFNIVASEGVTFTSDSGVLGSSWSPSVTPIPEPSAWAMMILGAAFAGSALRYRRRGSSQVIHS